MLGSARSPVNLLVALALAAGVVGFVVGIGSAHGRRHATSAPATRSITVAALTLRYPTSWRQAGAKETTPSLGLSNPIALAPAGRPGGAGLVAGQLAGTEQSPLPSRLLASLRGAPHTEIIQQAYVQAYRYRGLKPAASALAMELYVIPNPGEDATALACYAAPGLTAYLRQCEAIVASITVESPSGNGVIPDAGYASSLAGVIGPLSRERMRLRSLMHSAGTRRAVGELAAQLATRFAAAAKAVAALQAPPAASSAQPALSSALDRAASAYLGLAESATGAPEAYGAAAASVSRAEAGVTAALVSFDLLGYGSA